VLQWLKRIRVAVAVIFFLAVSFLFLDFYNLIPSSVHTFLTSMQVVPALMRTLVSLGFISFGLLFVLVLTLLYGRVYCSTICPLGILQDIVIRIAKRVNRRRWFRFKKQYYKVHYILLGITVLLAFSGSLILLNLFEPFSNYGRILSNVASPVVVLVNNAIAYIFELLGLLFIVRIPLLHVDIISVVLSLSFFVLVVYLSYFRGRLFCNLLCPAGALLGVLSRFSIFKIVIDENNCKECGLCERVCKANCIKSDSKEVDFAACVGCFNCIDVCPTVGMSYRKRRWKSSFALKDVDADRRVLLKASIIPMLGLFLPEIEKDSTAQTNKNRYAESRMHPISPPGSIGVDRFSSLCTACHLCISSCPTQVLYPSFLDYGVAGIFQPKMNYSASYCNYDCVICSQICPTGAILPLDSDMKKQIQIGKAYFEKKDCVVTTKEKDCGACSEHCPTKAVYMVPYGQLFLPEVNDELCVGCGACEYACPSEPRKAIFVRASHMHQKAKKPQSKKIKQSFDSNQDFPF
jgi:ferredoxin